MGRRGRKRELGRKKVRERFGSECGFVGTVEIIVERSGAGVA